MSEQPQGRPGRPPEDRFSRQLEIFDLVLPQLREHGAKALTMRRAAAAACMSVGGLNHYFPTKAELLFFPLMPSTCQAAHEDFVRRHRQLRKSDPEGFLRLFVTETVDAIIA